MLHELTPVQIDAMISTLSAVAMFSLLMFGMYFDRCKELERELERMKRK